MRNTLQADGRGSARLHSTAPATRQPAKVFLLVNSLVFIAFLANGQPVFMEQNGKPAEPGAAQNEENFFTRNFRQRIYLGAYSSYFDDNIRLMQVGYDCVLQLLSITPDFNLLDFGLGLDALVAFDNHGGPDQGRPISARITPGIELNWSVRIYVLPLSRIESRVFLEGSGITFIAYAREYPDNGTYLNLGTHVGLGIEYPLNTCKGYTSLRLFHSSNGKPYSENPALNAVGIMTGMQFK